MIWRLGIVSLHFLSYRTSPPFVFSFEVTEMKGDKDGFERNLSQPNVAGRKGAKKKYPNVGKTARREKKNGLRLANT